MNPVILDGETTMPTGAAHVARAEHAGSGDDATPSFLSETFMFLLPVSLLSTLALLAILVATH